MMTPEAVGFVETRNWAALMAASDAMNKTAPVKSLGEVQSGGGYVTTMVAGDVGAVRSAVEAGSEAAKALGEFVSENVIPQIHPDVFQRLLKGSSFKGPVPDYWALGLVETVGFTAMVMAADAGCKAADVTLIGQFVPGGGYLAVIFRGEVAAVEAAVSHGASEAAKVNKVVGRHVIPRPDVGLQTCYPIGGRDRKRDSVSMGIARGFIETKGFIPIVEGTDTALKAASVQALRWQRVGSGLMSVSLQGDVGAIRNAVEAGARAAQAVGEFKSSLILPGPHDAIERIIPQPKKKS